LNEYLDVHINKMAGLCSSYRLVWASRNQQNVPPTCVGSSGSTVAVCGGGGAWDLCYGLPPL